jgi:dihydroorotase
MHILRIKSGRVIDPTRGVDAVRDLWLADGIIVPDGFAADAADEEIDAAGLLVMPGFVDAHVHLREPGYEEAETIASGCAAALAGGFTTIVAMPNTTPCLDSLDVAAEILRKTDRISGPHVLLMPALTLGRAGKELTDIEQLDETFFGLVAGFTDDGCGLADEALARRAFELCGAQGQTVAQHCEVAAISAKAAGPDPYPDEAEAAMLARDIRLSEETGTHVHFQHLSSARSVELVRAAKARGVSVTAEATPHHLTLTEADAAAGGTNFKMNPPLRTEADRRALIEGLQDGTIDMIATDHAPHTAASKAKPFAEAPCGVIGLETAAAVVWTRLVRPGLLGPTEMAAAMSVRPAFHFGGDETPFGLRPHETCDAVIFDPNATWTVDPARLESKGRNCPFEGWELTGRVAATIVEGEVRYRADSG